MGSDSDEKDASPCAIRRQPAQVGQTVMRVNTVHISRVRRASKAAQPSSPQRTHRSVVWKQRLLAGSSLDVPKILPARRLEGPGRQGSHSRYPPADFPYGDRDRCPPSSGSRSLTPLCACLDANKVETSSLSANRLSRGSRRSHKESVSPF